MLLKAKANQMTARWVLGACVAMTMLVSRGYADAASDLVTALTSGSAETAVAAAQAAGPAGTAAIAPVAQLIGNADPLVAKHARLALDNLVDYACRPGADAEKQAAAAELEKLLAPEMPEFARRDALQLLGLAGSDVNVPAMAKLLSDPVLMQDAAMGLARIAAPSATQTLLDALKTADAAAQVEIVGAISSRTDKTSRQPLIDFAAANPKSEAAWAALEVLAGFALPPNEVFSLPSDATAEQRRRYVNCYIKVANTLAKNGEPMGAEAMYTRVLRLEPAPQQIAAVLMGLKDIGSGKVAESALSVLNTPGAHEIAEQVLVESTAAGIDAKLEAALVPLSGPSKASLLNVLAARKHPKLAELAAAAKSDPDPLVRMTAATLLGEAPADADVEAAIKSPLPWFRAPALEAYLKLAEGKLGAGDAAGALAMYESVINGDSEKAFKNAALKGIGKAGQASSREMVTKLMEDPAFSDAAGRALVDIVAAQGGDAAKNELLTMAESSPPAIASYAIEKLRPLGIGTEAIPQRKGFITNWKMLGPLPNDSGSAYEKSFFPEGQAELTPVEVDGKTLAWMDHVYDQVPAIINLRQVFNVGDVPAACYAVTDLKVDAETTVVFLIGTNDGCEFFVNGQKLHGTKEGRPLTIDQDRVEAKLAPGSNRIVLKVLQDGGQWEFVVRVTNPDGTPLDVSQHL